MKEFDRVTIASRAALRAWLQANHTRRESVWLVSYKKHVAEKYVSWDEIVEEALCFGWIDSLPTICAPTIPKRVLLHGGKNRKLPYMSGIVGKEKFRANFWV